MSPASDPPREESRCDGGSDGSARGDDTSNGASLQHWRRPPTTVLRGVGGLSITTPHGDRRPPVQWKWRLKSSTTPHGDRSSLHRGVRQAPLPEVAGPQAAVTVGYVAAVAPSLAVVLVSDMMHDDATVQFLLQQSLLARAQEEEEEAREQEEVKWLEEAVVTKMQRLEAEVMSTRDGTRPSSRTSRKLQSSSWRAPMPSGGGGRGGGKGRSRGRKNFLVLLVLVVDVPVFINDKFQQSVLQL